MARSRRIVLDRIAPRTPAPQPDTTDLHNALCHPEGMWRCLLALLILTATGQADDQVQRMAARLSEEAEAFARVAPQLLSRETLEQRALKPPSRFKPRFGADAQRPPQLKWQTRKIVSEYAYSTFSGSREALHEFRQAVQVDGRQVQKTEKALDALAQGITSTDDERKRRMLSDFEKLGLRGAVTDLGPIILLFTRRQIEKYEFLFMGRKPFDGDQALVFSYKQIDGPDRVTVFDASHGDKAIGLRPSGEVWVTAEYVPLRITMKVARRESDFQFRDEMTVDYAMTQHGVLAPKKASHREWQGANLIAENNFVYSDFHRFGASSDIKFEAAPIEPNAPKRKPSKPL
ncbi:MAG: hypothetical protein ABI823_10830 [Bryobacteraceae bacterium]